MSSTATVVSGIGTRVGADVGGTFTDVIVEDGSGSVVIRKAVSTPPSYDRAVVAAVRELAADSASENWVGISTGLEVLRARDAHPQRVTAGLEGHVDGDGRVAGDRVDRALVQQDLRGPRRVDRRLEVDGPG